MKLMKYFLIIALALYSCISIATQATQHLPNDRIHNPNGMILPKRFPVYVSGTTVINHPMPNFNKRILFTNNKYRGYPGCYIACYSHDQNSVYGVSKTIYVKGQIRVAGHYQGKICQPSGYVNKDISAAPYFKKLCNTRMKSCKNGCWAGGATGGWLGIGKFRRQ